MISYESFCALLPKEMLGIVSHETFLIHAKHYDILHKWQRVMQLVAHSTMADYWSRHVIDSLQLQLLYPGQLHWIDLGSGGGYPAVPIAIQNRHVSGFEMHMIESNSKKSSYLADVSRLLQLPAQVHCQRIEDGLRQNFGHALITARALADMSELLSYAYMIGQKSQSYECAFLKSNNVKEELTRASEWWRFECGIIPSLVDDRGCIVRIQNLEMRTNG